MLILGAFWSSFGSHFGPRSGFGETLIRATVTGETRFWGTKSELFYDFFRYRFSNTFFITFMSILEPFWAPFGTLWPSIFRVDFGVIFEAAF